MGANDTETFGSRDRDSDSLLSPERINAYRLRQATAGLAVSLVAGLTCWFTWVGFRDSDERFIKLISVMGFFLGCVLLFAAFVSVFGVVAHSIYCIYRFRFGARTLVFALLLLPLFILPFLFN